MKTKYLAIIAGLLISTSSALGQGEGLFKQRCNTCHMIDKASTGPALKGVKAKWADAGEGELIYDWVKNSQTLISSGKSTMAKKVESFSSSSMPNQTLSNEEIDQIFDYVDNFTPPPPPVTTGGTDPLISVVPDYEGNLNIFYALVLLTIILLLGITFVSKSIISFVRSEKFKSQITKNEHAKEGNGTKIILMIGVIASLLIPESASALSTPDLSNPLQAEYPWLLIEKSDLYILLAINVILFFILWHLKNLFNKVFQTVYPPVVKVKKPAANRVSKVLTDAVPIEEEASILLEHEYDGIRELDNNLPPWWLWGFYISIVFSFIYVFHYHILGSGDSQAVEYDKSMAQAKRDIDAYLKEAAMNVDETNVTLLTDESALSAGKGLFETNCTTCHKSGEGEIGPNLTDKFWLYGHDIKGVFTTIKKGTANGMPEHESKLNPVQLQQVASYVLSLKYKAGKAPEGTEVK